MLRWISLLGNAALLGGLGAANMHQKSFRLFLAAVLAAAVVTVAIFVATASEPSEE